MNGVRRLLGGGGQRPQSPPVANSSPAESFQSLPPLQATAPLSISRKPLWPPSPHLPSYESSNGRPSSASSSTISASPPRYTNGSKPYDSRQNSLDNNDIRPQSFGSSVSSPSRKPVPISPGSSPSSRTRVSNAPSGPPSPTRPMPTRVTQLRPWKRASGPVDTRDELLMSLLASEAVVESRDFDILHSDDVDELKKEYQILESRLSAMQKKLKLEVKIRDAAASLAKVNASHKTVSKQTAEHLEASNRKVESVQKELWRISERANEINKKLLEHRAGVLSFSLKSIESRIATESEEAGYAFRNSQMSPTSSETSYSSSRTKFEGPHLFAGHENALTPMSPRKPVSAAEYTFLEERLKEMTTKLQTAVDAQNEAKREASLLKVELEGLETSTALDLQAAEEKIANLESEIENSRSLEYRVKELLAQQEQWIEERESKARDIEMLERRLEVMEEKSGEVVGVERRAFELEEALDALQKMMISRNLRIPDGIPVTERISHLGSHIDHMQSELADQRYQNESLESLRARLEDDMQTSTARQEDFSKELEQMRLERDKSREVIRTLEFRLQEQAAAHAEASKSISLDNAPPEVMDVVNVLKPIWNALPSPESRASKFGQRSRVSPISTPGSPNTSLSELDVRLLKTLYDGRPAYQIPDTSGQFTVEAFAARVQALIVDDRALIERLVRFAQAHDLLKKNAERAQKIAQDSSVALETYQKQVKALEDRNLTLQSSITSLHDEIVELQDAIDKIVVEKRDVEMQAAEQAETCRQLTEANNALSARALSLAEEAASAPKAVRLELEKQLAECRLDLQKAEDDIQAMRSAEASQSLALMDELNQLQGENDTLRAQLRAYQAGKK